MFIRAASAAAVTSLLLLAPSAGAVSPDIVISQVYGGGGNAGATYLNDYVELYNRGASPVSVAGWSVQYASATGSGAFSANGVTALSGTVPAGARQLVKLGSGGSAGVALPPADATGTTNLSGSAGKVIVARTATGLACNGGSLPCSPTQTSQIVDLVGYGNATFFEGAAPAPAPSSGATAAVLRKAGGCTETDENAADFESGPARPGNASIAPSPCAATPPPPVETCGDPATRVAAVQGAGTTSPLDGQVVSVEGVVVGHYQQSGGFGGFFLQDTTPDVDPSTAEGVFVRSADAVAAGDRVRVRGTVDELVSGGSSLTAITNTTQVLICADGDTAVAPTVLPLPAPSRAAFERYEGMLVRVTQPLTVTETFTLGRFGEARLAAGGRLFTPTNQVPPGPEATALADLNARRSFVLDDGDNRQNVDPTRYPSGGLSSTNTLRSGFTVPQLDGVFDERFGSYRVQPVGDVPFTATNPRPAAPAAVGGTLKVVAFNVLNFFNGPAFPTARGASTPQELQRQTAKEVAALVGLDADVVGLMELENDGGTEQAIADLVDAVNATAGAGTYAFVDTGVVGTDQIRVGLLYKPAVVRSVGAPAVLDSTVDPRFVDTLNRPTIAQAFELRDNRERVVVAVNHLKSKGSACAGDPNLGDGQGNCNGTRLRAAGALADWLQGDPTGAGTSDTLIIGDLNAYAEEDPIRALRDAGFVDQIRRFNGTEAYSYVFDGQAGYLDHGLASPSLSPKVTGATDWHVNADEPIALDYNTEFKTPGQVASFYAPDAYRSSDHDPLLVGLDLRPTFADAIALTQQLVDREGVARALVAKLEAAQRARERGDAAAEADVLQGYRDQLVAQSGKTIDPDDAAALQRISAQLTEA